MKLHEPKDSTLYYGQTNEEEVSPISSLSLFSIRLNWLMTSTLAAAVPVFPGVPPVGKSPTTVLLTSFVLKTDLT